MGDASPLPVSYVFTFTMYSLIVLPEYFQNKGYTRTVVQHNDEFGSLPPSPPSTKQKVDAPEGMTESTNKGLSRPNSAVIGQHAHLGSRDSSCILVLSPRIEPPVRMLDGSTEITATRLPAAARSLPSTWHTQRNNSKHASRERCVVHSVSVFLLFLTCSIPRYRFCVR